MIIYNVTIKVDWAIHDKWMEWLKQEHIPSMLQTGCFHDSKILRLLETDDYDGPTYAIQYHAFSSEDYKKFILYHAPSLVKYGNDQWGQQTVAFSSVMEVLH